METAVAFLRPAFIYLAFWASLTILRHQETECRCSEYTAISFSIWAEARMGRVLARRDAFIDVIIHEIVGLSASEGTVRKCK